MNRKMLYAVVCGAGPAGHVDVLVNLAHERDWEVQVIATPSALDFIDVPLLERLTRNRVRSQYRKPGEIRSSPADAMVVAPATYNTINKLAQGASDTYALGVVGEAIGLGVPVVVLPFVNSALASRRPFRRSVDALRGEGVLVLFEGKDGISAHEPGSGDSLVEAFPWEVAIDAATLSVSGPGIST